MKILVTGGAGYIGSFMTQHLLDRGHDVVVFDNLKRGHKEAVDSRARLIVGDLRDDEALMDLFSDKFDAVLHFAGLISVEESTRDQNLYFENNVVGSKKLISKAKDSGINRVIFSSTAAVYGNPQTIPIPEEHPKNPTSPYGVTKLEIESYLASLRKESSEFSFACLRYFNAAGAALNGQLGEDHSPETHIIPLAIKSAITGSEFRLFGADYNTPDGTCIRDYIHVLDLVDAHLLALEKIFQPGGYYYNVGTGRGHSNREVLNMIENVSGKKINVAESDKRPGDADRLVADPTSINRELNFSPRYSDLETIVKSAWLWHNR